MPATRSRAPPRGDIAPSSAVRSARPGRPAPPSSRSTGYGCLRESTARSRDRGERGGVLRRRTCPRPAVRLLLRQGGTPAPRGGPPLSCDDDATTRTGEGGSSRRLPWIDQQPHGARERIPFRSLIRELLPS